MSECKVLNALVSTCQECEEDCEDAKYEVLKLLAEAKEVNGPVIDMNQPDSKWTWFSFGIRR